MPEWVVTRPVREDDHESAGSVFAEALRQWREAISRRPDASPSDPEGDEPTDTDADEPA
jgi:hypothetical protein